MAKIRKVVRRTIEQRDDGTHTITGVNAAIAANVGEGGSTSTRSSSRQRIVQRSGRTIAESEHTVESSEEGGAGGPLHPGELREEEPTELPHREGTYERLQEKAEDELAEGKISDPEEDQTQR